MKYQIKFDKRCIKALEKISVVFRKDINETINGLKNNPRPDGCKKLKGNDGLYRVRSGDYRIIYMINDNELLVLLIEIGHRKDVYK